MKKHCRPKSRILVFDMIMGMLCLWAGGKRQDTTAPASQEVSTGKITGYPSRSFGSR